MCVITMYILDLWISILLIILYIVHISFSILSSMEVEFISSQHRYLFNVHLYSVRNVVIFVYLNNITLFLTSSISAILSGTIGIHYGHVLIHFKVTKSYPTLYIIHMHITNIYFINWILLVKGLKQMKFLQGHWDRLKQWVSMGFVLLTIAIILHFTNGNSVTTTSQNSSKKREKLSSR